MKLCPPVKQYLETSGVCCLDKLDRPICGTDVGAFWLESLPDALRPQAVVGQPLCYHAGEVLMLPAPQEPESYVLEITADGIHLRGADLQGLRYGLDTLAQIVAQAHHGVIPCLSVSDRPSIPKRGLMLDVSRGKVYTREYLIGLVDLLAKLRYNVFQLYIEHTFAFQTHPEICEGADAVTAEDILAVQEACKQRGVELQANLQSLGHAERVLTRKQHMDLAESDMYWSYSTTSDGVMALLDELYGEYLPLFESEYLNVCLDEPYDIGRGQSALAREAGRDLYGEYFLKLHKLAKKYGKRLMAFGDVFRKDPQRLKAMPEDVIYIDWCYDPKLEYGTPAVFGASGREFWICPGTGNWNTLFPRLDGAVQNILQMTKEGLEAHTGGMLLTDWNDHGAYAQPGASYYLYAYGAAVAWCGEDPGRLLVGSYADRVLRMPGYGKAMQIMAKIYWIPPLWSKNRSQCAMALFDEPIFGKSVRGPVPPEGLRAYDLKLPEGVAPVFERHSQHPLRPFFQITPEACGQIRGILKEAEGVLQSLPEGKVKEQLVYTADGFALMLDKLALSRKILAYFEEGDVTTRGLLFLEDEVRTLTARLVRLQFTYYRLWTEVARLSEIEKSMVYFANVISRMDYLRDWLTIQRENISKGEPVDLSFRTYETAGYTTLPTY